MGVHAIGRLIRFPEYGPLFLLTGLFGALLAFAPLDLKLMLLGLFIATSAAFGFIINDISDTNLDAHESRPRNPLADGTCPLSAAYATSLVILGVSLICLVLLPLPLILLGGVQLFIFATYSFGIKAKNIAGFDLVYHGLFPALYGAMGYLLYRSFDLTFSVLFLVLFIFGAVAEIFNEIRDYNKDRLIRKNYVVVIGKRRAFGVTLALLAAALACIAVFAVIHPRLRWLLVVIPSGLLLIYPVWQAMKDARFEPLFVHTVNTRAILIAIAMVVLFAVGRLSGIIL